MNLQKLRGKIIIALFIVVFSTNACSQAQGLDRDLKSIVTPTIEVLTSTPSSDFHHWLTVVPGVSTKEDVLEILGTPDIERETNLPNSDFKVPEWFYESLEGRQPWICTEPCTGYGSVYFLETQVIMIELVLYGGPKVIDLVSILGEPEFSRAFKWLPPRPGDQEELEEQGIDWRNMVSLWRFLYPNYGAKFIIGPRFDEVEWTIPEYYPPDSEPPDDMSVTVMRLFPPMSAEDFWDSYFVSYEDTFLNPD